MDRIDARGRDLRQAGGAPARPHRSHAPAAARPDPGALWPARAQKGAFKFGHTCSDTHLLRQLIGHPCTDDVLPLCPSSKDCAVHSTGKQLPHTPAQAGQ